jgi:ATP synthase protein I
VSPEPNSNSPNSDFQESQGRDVENPNRPVRQSWRLEFRHQVRRKLSRHQKAQREKNGLFFGLGVFGVVGWSVAIPTLLGIALGLWIDRRWPSQYSWTLMLLFVGVVLGCLNAWFWIDSSHRGD